MENYTVYTKDIVKAKSSFSNINEIMEYLKQKAEEHKAAKFIAVFDHYQHTKSLEDGEIAEGIIDAKNFIFYPLMEQYFPFFFFCNTKYQQSFK